MDLLHLLTEVKLSLARRSVCSVLILFFLCKVIGDKKGGATSALLRHPDKSSILEEIRDVVQVPMKFIHVTRNPFDNIATMLLRALFARDNVRGDDAQKVGVKGEVPRKFAVISKPKNVLPVIRNNEITVKFVINYHPSAIKLSISASGQRQRR